MRRLRIYQTVVFAINKVIILNVFIFCCCIKHKSSFLYYIHVTGMTIKFATKCYILFLAPTRSSRKANVRLSVCLFVRFKFE